MKAATVIAVALATFSSFPSPAQQDQQAQQTPPTLQASLQPAAAFQEPVSPSPQSQASPAQAQGVPAQAQSEQQPNVKTIQLQLITGELQQKLDSNSAKQGDSVVLKTREDVKIPDGTEIPKGSKLVGHVTNVQPRGEGKENSQITLQFDRAELKGGSTLPIQSVLESVSPSAGESTMENNNGGMSPMQPSTNAAEMPNSRSGSAAPNPANNGTNQNAGNEHPGMASGTASQTPDQNAANGSPAPGSIVARSGNVAIRATSIPGVLVANNINGQPFSNASGMLLGARRDIKLDGGTQMVVAVTSTPQAGGSGMVR